MSSIKRLIHKNRYNRNTLSLRKPNSKLKCKLLCKKYRFKHLLKNKLVRISKKIQKNHPTH